VSHVTDLIYPFLASLDNPDSCTGLSVDLFEAAMKELVTEVPTGLPLLGDFHGDQNSLRAQRWGIVVPEGSNETELLDQIAPLIKLRESQQGASAIVYKAPHALDARAASKWCDNIY